ncbi:MAG TPA: hypothetical protein VE861_05810 [Gemmatimonadaceae bacterium]|nr:hypothetical protein [Gemmatimonadaceae bacterium]
MRLELATDGRRMQGELLAVDTTGVLTWTTIVTHVRWSAMRTFEVRKLGDQYRVSGGAQPSMMQVTRLSLVSHFPQGIEPAVLAKLLENTKQKSVEEVR